MQTSKVHESDESKIDETIETSLNDTILEDGDAKTRKKRKRTCRSSIVRCDVVTAHNLITYKWPLDQDNSDDDVEDLEKPEEYMIQEQVANFLGITSFKRKYPQIFRKTVEMVERDYLLEKNFVSEKMCNLGLTKLVADDVYEIMSNDYPSKWNEYMEHCNEKRRKMDHSQLVSNREKLDNENMNKFIKKAIKSAFNFNAQLQKRRLKYHKSYLDFQTFNIHTPVHPLKEDDIVVKDKDYSVAMVPQQYQHYYREYTKDELNKIPLGTIICPTRLSRNTPVIIPVQLDSVVPKNTGIIQQNNSNFYNGMTPRMINKIPNQNSVGMSTSMPMRYIQQATQPLSINAKNPPDANVRYISNSTNFC